MTDARLPGPWLFRLAWIRLSDRAARTLAASLMWANESGTDGDLPPEAFSFLHPAGVDDATAAELIAAGWWERTPVGYRVHDWTGTAGQESAEQIASRRANNRKRQREHRDKQRDVTRDMPRDEARYPVGQDRTGAVTEPTLLPTSAALESAECVPPGECERRRAFPHPSPCPRHREAARAVAT